MTDTIEWTEEWDAHDDGVPYCYDVGYLGDYSASVGCSGACIHYGGLPADLGISITLDDSVMDTNIPIIHAGRELLTEWAEERLRYRAQHGHTSRDVTGSVHPSNKPLPWVCMKPEYHNWLDCELCLIGYDFYRSERE